MREPELRLADGEEVIWSGSPTPLPRWGRQVVVPAFMFFVSSIVLSTIALELNLLDSPVGGVAIGSTIASVMAAAQYAALRSYWNNTRFVLTNQRAVVTLSKRGLFAWLLSRSVSLRELGTPRLDRRDDGDDVIWLGSAGPRVKLWFDGCAFPSWPHPPKQTAFVLVRTDAEHVFENVRSAVTAAKRG